MLKESNVHLYDDRPEVYIILSIENYGVLAYTVKSKCSVKSRLNDTK